MAFSLASQSGTPEPSIAAASVHYGPGEEASRADTDAIALARRSVDMAAFVLNDRDVIDALVAAAHRGVAIRIYLDRDELDRISSRAMSDIAALARAANVSIRAKARNTEAMHLKSYVVDRRLLRTGSANFTYSGERRQDNDIVILESIPLAAAFTRMFDGMWSQVGNEEIGR